MDGYPISVAANSLISTICSWVSTKPDILHTVFLQLAAVIRVTFIPFLLNFPQMLELVDSYLHDFIWPQCLLLWLDISLRKKAYRYSWVYHHLNFTLSYEGKCISDCTLTRHQQFMFFFVLRIAGSYRRKARWFAEIPEAHQECQFMPSSWVNSCCGSLLHCIHCRSCIGFCGFLCNNPVLKLIIPSWLS